jgi:hypothetical protein
MDWGFCFSPPGEGVSPGALLSPGVLTKSIRKAHRVNAPPAHEALHLVQKFLKTLLG